MSASKITGWCGVSCHTDRDRAAIRTWFGAMVPANWEGPLKADLLECLKTGREKKLRALFRRPDGQLREASRTLGGRTTTVAIKPPSRTILADYREAT